MHRQILVVNNASYRHSVKYLHKQLIDLYVVLLYDLIPESKVFGHVSTLVVTPQKNNFIRVVDLET